MKYIVYTQLNKLGEKASFDNAKDAIKWAKDNIPYFDTWEILFEELLVWIEKGEVVNA